jgi:very-short-patch-repair endonuclease
MRSTKKYMSLPYNPTLKERARALRSAGNLSEVLLWNQLKNKQFFALDFDRQKIIGNYIVDFYCAEKQVVLEVDGSSHDNKADYDAQRDAFLIGLDLTVVHILDIDVKINLAGVMGFLRNHSVFVGHHRAPAHHPAPSGHPSMGGE